MDRIKRKTDSNDQIEKKLRCIMNEKSSIEDLSNEIFYEIFDYLDGYDIHYAFHHLNTRFQQLFTSSSLLLKFFVADNGDESQITLEDYCRDVIIPNRHRILSLQLIDLSLIDGFLTYCLVNETFNRLESITLKDIPIINLPATLFYFKTLPRLFSLNITLEMEHYSSIDLSEIYRILLRLPFLKYNRLISKGLQVTDLIPLAFNEAFSTIEYLIMKHNCSLTRLVSILDHTPRLIHLTCEILSKSYDSLENDLSLKLPNLICLRISKCSINFDDFRKFIQMIGFQLKQLFIGQFFYGNYTEPDQWKHLIIDYIPRLQKFDLNYLISTDSNYNNIDLNSFIHQSTSQFWFEQGWTFNIELHCVRFIYSINSTKKLWWNFDDENSILQKTNLCIRRFIEKEWEEDFINIYKPILEKIQFTSLYISRSANLSFDDFIEILTYLPNLNSLKISYLSLASFNNLLDKNTEIFRRLAINNKVRRVYQRMNTDLADIIIDLCRRMEYLEIDRVQEKDLNHLIRFILHKRLTNNYDLHSICLHSDQLNNGVIDGLTRMIDSEKLLVNYHMKYEDKKILLQWE